mmetsp:Transcript_12733/g.9242  ORF Transcript_12733/g.9242 Transcript_12733/m.9242 type:complete len:107 (+) Transcript_12733:102-422(+)
MILFGFVFSSHWYNDDVFVSVFTVVLCAQISVEATAVLRDMCSGEEILLMKREMFRHNVHINIPWCYQQGNSDEDFHSFISFFLLFRFKGKQQNKTKNLFFFFLSV